MLKTQLVAMAFPQTGKDWGETVCGPVACIINSCFEKCTFPDILKNANVIPVFKKQDRLKGFNIMTRTKQS